jgi:hypothetical protein
MGLACIAKVSELLAIALVFTVKAWAFAVMDLVLLVFSIYSEGLGFCGNGFSAFGDGLGCCGESIGSGGLSLGYCGDGF